MRPKHILPVLFLLAAVTARLTLAPLSSVSAQVPACSGVPFTDIADTVFCAVIKTAYYTGITSGTSATTFNPIDPVTREQAAAFASRSLSGAMLRANQRTALGFLWTPVSAAAIATIGTTPTGIASDGQDLWIADGGSQKLFRVSHTGAVLGTWTGLAGAADVLVAPGKIVVTGTNASIYSVDPSQPGTAVSPIGTSPFAGGVGLAFDGQKIWRPSATASTLSLLNADGTYLAEFGPTPSPVKGVFYDGTYMWLLGSTGTLRRIDPFAFVTADVALGVTVSSPVHMAFDGANLWVPVPDSNQIIVVRSSSQAVVSTIQGNGLAGPNSIAFDGLRMMVTNKGGNSVSIFQAVDLTPLGSIALSQSPNPAQVASDAINFFVIGSASGQLLKF